jgi:hypothetical protein
MLLSYLYNSAIYIYTAVTSQTISLFNKMIVIDSIISASEYIANVFISNKINPSQIIEDINEKEKDIKNNNIKCIYYYLPEKYYCKFNFNQEITIYQKYFLFFVCDIIFLLSNQNTIIENILLLNAFSPFLELIIYSTYFNIIYNKFIDNVLHTIKYILSNITAKILNDITQISYNTNPNIDYYEIYSYYENINELCNNILIFAKTFFVLFYYNYLKNTSNAFYKIILNTLYKYNTQELLNFYNSKLSEAEKKEFIKDIISHRKWKQFLEPKTLNIFFELYYKNNQQLLENKIVNLTNKLNLNFKRFLALWSINLLSCYFTIIIDIYFVFIRQIYSVHNLHNYILACILNISGLLSFDFLGPFMIVTSDIILTFITKHCIEKIEIENKTKLAYKLLFCFLIYFANYYSYFYVFYSIINIYVFQVNIKKRRYFIIYSTTIIFSSLSNFAIINIIIINYLIHKMIYNYYMNNKKIEIIIDKPETDNKVKKIIQSLKNRIIQEYF